MTHIPNHQIIHTTPFHNGKSISARPVAPTQLNKELATPIDDKFTHRYEWINLNGTESVVKPYFDYDYNTTDAAEVRDNVLASCLKTLRYHFPNDLILTQTTLREDKVSYHFKIPSLKTTTKELKKLIDFLYEADKCWDRGVYCPNRKFRLVNRSKEGKGKYCIPHKCSYNSLLEFVVTHVEEGAKDWVCQLSTPIPRGISTATISTADIKTILTELQYDDFGEYPQWFRLMAMIKNSAVHEQQAYDLFVEFSRQSPAKFDEESLMYTWSSIGKKEHKRPLTRKSLERLCRGEDNFGFDAIPSVVSIFGKQETDYIKFLKERT